MKDLDTQKSRLHREMDQATPRSKAAHETQDLTLRGRLGYLEALTDTDSEVPAELREEFELEIATALQGTREKVDGVAAVSLRLMEESAINAAKLATQKAEYERLKGRQARMEREIATFGDYVLFCIEQYGHQEKRKTYKQIDGATATLAAYNCPASVEVEDASLVPLDYQSIELKLTPKRYAAVRKMLSAGADLLDHSRGCAALIETICAGKIEPSKTAIGEVLKQKCEECGGDGGYFVMNPLSESQERRECPACAGTGHKLVSGARLVQDKKRLVIS